MSQRTTGFNRFLGYQNGELVVDEVSCTELIERFGTPLYVISERQIRYNVERFRSAFRTRYPNTDVLFATKANNNLAVRRVYTEAGAGADCFGLGELLVSLHAGTRPELMVLNGWLKTDAELGLAIRYGITIHLDSVDEFDQVVQVAHELGLPARIGIRTRLMMRDLDTVMSDWPGPGSPAEGDPVGVNMRERDKYGISEADIPELCKQAEHDPLITLAGLHNHVGRERGDTTVITAAIAEQLELAMRLRDELGWLPQYLDFGGGMAFGRPEGHGPLGRDRAVPSYEEYAEDIIATLREGLANYDLGEPRLIVEPGRSLASNTGVLLSRVRGRKHVPETGQTWLGVDASQNHLLNNLSGGFYYHPVPVREPSGPVTDRVNIADPQCWYGNLALDVQFPVLDVGESLAFLDTGAYCESKALNFNLSPRPATVLVRGGDADLVTRRENLDEVLQRVQVPERLGADRTGMPLPAVPGVPPWMLPSWAVPAPGPARPHAR
jgi:diaminopimelate decarboxylase